MPEENQGNKLDKKYFSIVEKYVFLGQLRYRVQVIGTNIVFNITASSDEEAIERAVELASKTGLTKEVVNMIKEKIKEETY